MERDLRAYLDCGIQARGFGRGRCPDCAIERLVAFSCRARSCPSCNARRMEDAADHLAHDVFPKVPVRQWVLSFPRRLRFLAARNPRVASRLLDLFTRTLFAWQRRRARRLGADDLPGRSASRTRVPWAELLRKVFAVGVLECPRCTGRLEVVAYVAEAAVAKRILDHLGMDAQAPPLARARAPEDDAPADAGADCGAGDPVYQD